MDKWKELKIFIQALQKNFYDIKAQYGDRYDFGDCYDIIINRMEKCEQDEKSEEDSKSDKTTS